MKLLINICAHDGIISYYTGVGTMVGRYIKAFNHILNEKNFEYDINLYTPEYNEDSFGFNKYKKIVNSKFNIFEVSNGTNGTVNFGSINEWKKLSINTARLINEIDYSKYDKVITICNDTPYACLINYLNDNKNHIKIWIPHSTIKIHEVDSAIPNSIEFYQLRLDWEMDSINYINKNSNCFVGCICNYMKKHLLKEYNLSEEKAINIFNGEILEEFIYEYSNKSLELMKEIEKYDSILISFARAEEYKNLEGTMYLGKELNIPTIVIAQYYYKEQPILKEYVKISKETGTHLYISPPFDFSKCILNNYKKNIILLVPSKREVMGLIINEARKLNRDNILIVSNNTGGLTEQIEDTKDGILIDIDDVKNSAIKIKKYFNSQSMKEMNKKSQKKLKREYNFYNIINDLINTIVED